MLKVNNIEGRSPKASGNVEQNNAPGRGVFWSEIARHCAIGARSQRSIIAGTKDLELWDSRQPDGCGSDAR